MPEFAIRTKVELAFQAQGLGNVLKEFQKILNTIEAEAKRGAPPRQTAQSIAEARSAFGEQVTSRVGTGPKALLPEQATKYQAEMARAIEGLIKSLNDARAKVVTSGANTDQAARASAAQALRQQREKEQAKPVGVPQPIGQRAVLVAGRRPAVEKAIEVAQQGEVKARNNLIVTYNRAADALRLVAKRSDFFRQEVNLRNALTQRNKAISEYDAGGGSRERVDAAERNVAGQLTRISETAQKIAQLGGTVDETKAVLDDLWQAVGTLTVATQSAAQAEEQLTTETKAEVQTTKRRRTGKVKTLRQEDRNQEATAERLLTPRTTEATTTRAAATATQRQTQQKQTATETVVRAARVEAEASDGLAEAKEAARAEFEREARITADVVAAERRLLDAKALATLALRGEAQVTEKATQEAAAADGGALPAGATATPRAGRPLPGQKTPGAGGADQLTPLQLAFRRLRGAADLATEQLKEVRTQGSKFREASLKLAEAQAGLADELSQEARLTSARTTAALAALRTRAGVQEGLTDPTTAAGQEAAQLGGRLLVANRYGRVQAQRAGGDKLAAANADLLVASKDQTRQAREQGRKSGELTLAEGLLQVEMLQGRLALAKLNNETGEVAAIEAELSVELRKLANAAGQLAKAHEDYEESFRSKGELSAEQGVLSAEGRRRVTDDPAYLRAEALRAAERKPQLQRFELHDPAIRDAVAERKRLARQILALEKRNLLANTAEGSAARKALHEITLLDQEIADLRRAARDEYRNRPTTKIAGEKRAGGNLQAELDLLEGTGAVSAAESEQYRELLADRNAKQRRVNTLKQQELLKTEAGQKAIAEEEAARFQVAQFRKQIRDRLAKEAAGPGQALGGFGRLQEAFQGPGLGQLLGRRFITTASFAATGMSFRGAIQGIGSVINQAEQLQRLFSQIEAQFTSIDQAGQFPYFRKSMLEIARTTGIAADQVAHVGFQIKGVYGEDTVRATRETAAAMRAALVTGLPQREIVDSLTAASLAFGVSIDTITDKAIGIEERFGVLSAESIKFFGDIASTAELTGLSIDELGTTLGVLQQKLGVSGGALAEQFSRLLGSVTDNLPQLVEIFDRFPTLRGMEGLQENVAKGSGAALFELARGWHTLGSAQQQAIAKQLGGTRQFQTTMNALEGLNEQILKGNVYIDDSGKAVERETNLQRTFGQQLNRTREVLRQFGNTLIEIGATTVIADLLYGFQGMLSVIQAITTPLRLINDAFNGWVGRIGAVVAMMVTLRTIMGTVTAMMAVFMKTGVPGVVGRVGLGGAGGAPTPLSTRAPGMLGFLGLTSQRGFLGQGGRGRGAGGPSLRYRMRQALFGSGIGLEGGPIVDAPFDEPPPRSTRGTPPPDWDTPLTPPVAPQVRSRAARARAGLGRSVANLRASRAQQRATQRAIDIEAERTQAETARAAAQANAASGGAISGPVPGAGAAVPAAAARSGLMRALGGRLVGFMGSPAFMIGTIALGIAASAAAQRKEAARLAGESARAIIEAEFSPNMTAKEQQELEAKKRGVQADADKADTDFQKFLAWLPVFSSKSKGQETRDTIEKIDREKKAPGIQLQLKALEKAGILAQADIFGGDKEKLQEMILKLFEGDKKAYELFLAAIQAALGGATPGETGAYQVELAALEEANATATRLEDVRKSVEQMTRLRSVGGVSNKAAVLRLEQARDALHAQLEAYKRTGQVPPEDLTNAAIEAEKAVLDAQKEISDGAIANANAVLDVRKAGTRDPVKVARFNLQQARNDLAGARKAVEVAASQRRKHTVTQAEESWNKEWGMALADRTAYAMSAVADARTAAKARLTSEQKAQAMLKAGVISKDDLDFLRNQAAQGMDFDKGLERHLDRASDSKKAAYDVLVEGLVSADYSVRTAEQFLRDLKAEGIPKMPARPALPDRVEDWTDVDWAADTAYKQAEARVEEFEKAERDALLEEEDARTKLKRVKEGKGKNAVVAAKRAREDADLAMKRAKDLDLGVVAEINAQIAQIEADRAGEEAQFEIGQARLRLLQATASAAGRDTKAAQLAVQIVREELARQMKLDPTDELAITNYRTQLKQLEDQRAATFVSERREIIDFQRQMGEITVGQAIAQLQALLRSPEVQSNEDRVREIRLAIRNLQQEAASNLQFNIGDLRLPTLYEARRLGATRAMGTGYNDNRQIVVHMNNYNATDYQGSIDTFVGLMNQPSRQGTYSSIYPS